MTRRTAVNTFYSCLAGKSMRMRIAYIRFAIHIIFSCNRQWSDFIHFLPRKSLGVSQLPLLLWNNAKHKTWKIGFMKYRKGTWETSTYSSHLVYFHVMNVFHGGFRLTFWTGIQTVQHYEGCHFLETWKKSEKLAGRRKVREFWWNLTKLENFKVIRGLTINYQDRIYLQQYTWATASIFWLTGPHTGRIVTQWRYCKQSKDWMEQTYLQPLLLRSEISLFWRTSRARDFF